MAESNDYVQCMTLTKNVDPMVYQALPPEVIKQINEYIDAPMTATWFSDKNGKSRHSREIITSQIIYYWMIACEIPFECEKWHLNRLMTLIHVCNVKNQPKKKLGKSELGNRNTALNKARRAKMHSRG